MSTVKHLRKLDPTPVARAATGAAGLPAPPAWAGYWTFVSATLILAFVLYLAKHGRLSTWLAFFTPQAPAAIASATDSSGTVGSPIGTVLGVPGVTTLSPGATGITQTPSGQQILNPGAPFDFGGAATGIQNTLKNWFAPFNSAPANSSGSGVTGLGSGSGNGGAAGNGSAGGQ